MEIEKAMDAHILEVCSRETLSLAHSEACDEQSPFFQQSAHKAACTELIYFTKGSAKVVCGDQNVIAEMFDVVVIPRNAVHRVTLNGANPAGCVVLQLDVKSYPLHDFLIVPDNHAKIKIIFSRCHIENSTDPCSLLLINHLLHCVLIYILLENEKHYSKKDASIRKIVHYVYSHYTEKLTLSDLADMIYVSPAYLSRKFKVIHGNSLTKFINTLRINDAMQQLGATNLSVEEISERVGYNSPKYFCRIFKSIVGMTPKDFRKEQQRNQSA